MNWILVLLIVTHDGQLTASRGEKPMAQARCEAIGHAQAVRLAEQNRSAQHLCISVDAPPPVRPSDPVRKNT